MVGRPRSFRTGLTSSAPSEQKRKTMKRLTAIIQPEGKGYVSLCPALDIASQGETVELATSNLREALELFFETAHPNEITQRLTSEIYITPLEVEIGQIA